jgi:hypothetical protein
MRTHGWGGSTPSSDEEAIERILDAADAVIDAEDGDFHVAKVARALGISLEALAFTLDSVVEEKGIRLLFAVDLSRASRRITSAEVVQFNRDLLRRTDVDWSAAGMGDAQLEDICEYILRIIELFMIDPGQIGTGPALRAYLRRWVVPVFRAEVESHRSSGQRKGARARAAL